MGQEGQPRPESDSTGTGAGAAPQSIKQESFATGSPDFVATAVFTKRSKYTVRERQSHENEEGRLIPPVIGPRWKFFGLRGIPRGNPGY